MPTTLRSLCVFACVAAAACGASPTAPESGSGSGATIAGTAALGSSTKGIHALAGTPAANLTVSVAGTDLSTTTNAAGYFQLTGVPARTVRLQFRQSGVDASAEVPNVSGRELVTIEVQVSGSTATIVSETRSESKVSICHRTDGINGFHMISVAPSAEPAHRDHGDARPTERVPGTQAQIFDQSCQAIGPAIDIEKRTNGQDADSAPGPSIRVGDPVTWTYAVTNTGTVNLTGVTVADDRGVAVSCPATTLTPAQSITCTGSGSAVPGQYRNVGRATAVGANPSGSGTSTVSAEDASHYLGVEERDGPKVELCHRTGNGSFHLISIAVSAEPAHRAHGDGKVGEAVPGQAGRTFGGDCSVR